MSDLIKNQESATGQSGKQNAQDEPTAESAQAKPADAALEPQAGGGSAPSFCSGVAGSDWDYVEYSDRIIRYDRNWNLIEEGSQGDFQSL